jgi:ATP-dependent Lhr-like helicase
MEWWTFAGTRANATLASELRALCGGNVEYDALTITVEGSAGPPVVERAVRELSMRNPATMAARIEEAALEGLKFSQCLPDKLALDTLASRLRDEPAIRAALAQPLQVVCGA